MAIGIYGVLLDQASTMFGDKHPGFIHVIQEVAHLHKSISLGDFCNSIGLLKKVYKSYENLMGESALEKLSCVSILADPSISAKNYAEAIALAQLILS